MKLRLMLIVLLLISSVCMAEDKLENTLLRHYYCPIHGRIDESNTISLKFDDDQKYNGRYCARCLGERMRYSFFNLKEVK